MKNTISLRIAKIVNENILVKSFYFNYSLSALPGQVMMVTVPGYDEKPFGAVVLDQYTFLISVAAVGPATHALHAFKEGDTLSMVGPYGDSFILPADNRKPLALIAGGYGMVPLGYLAKYAVERGYTVEIFIGAKTKEELLIYSWLKMLPITIHIATDDGSQGFKGFVTDLFAQILEKSAYAKVYIVGPEIMEKKIVDLCKTHDIPFQVSAKEIIT